MDTATSADITTYIDAWLADQGPRLDQRTLDFALDVRLMVADSGDEPSASDVETRTAA